MGKIMMSTREVWSERRESLCLLGIARLFAEWVSAAEMKENGHYWSTRHYR